MNDNQYKALKEDISKIKQDNIEEIILMTSYCIKTYIYSTLRFGIKSDVTKDILLLWREFLSIIKKEDSFLNILLRNFNSVNIDEVSNFLVELDILNEDTILYYYDVLDGIEDACDTKKYWKATRNKKNFDTLIESDEYINKLCGLFLSLDDIKEFFGYNDCFWKYVENRIYVVDSNDIDNKDFYGVNIKIDENQILEDIKIFVPKIINLETALVNVHEFKHAYDLYCILGNNINKSDKYFEKDSCNSEDEFKKKYLVKKYQLINTSVR